MNFSLFGEKLTAGSGIVSLMEDLGEALRVNPDMLFLGGGNPAHIPPVARELQSALQQVLDTPEKAGPMLGVYQSPAGDTDLRDALAALLQREYGWPVTRDNLALANGSQSAFFTLFNLLGGRHRDGSDRHIQLPLVPEYLGYTDLGIAEGLYRAQRPRIDYHDGREFKYRLDLGELELGPDCAALCVSRPTNPTGNVVTDAEVAELDQRACKAGVPLVLDVAYGQPFPDIVFTETRPHWNDNTILVMSLSKLGLPGLRTSVVLAGEPLIKAFAKANTVLSLAAGNAGPAVMDQLIRGDRLLALGREQVAPFYRERSRSAQAIFHRALRGLPYRIHKSEGAIFLWLWFEGLPISAQTLYERLKARGVLVIAGHHFFPGLEQEWDHRHECLRVSYAQPDAVIEQAAAIVAEEVRSAYQ